MGRFDRRPNCNVEFSLSGGRDATRLFLSDKSSLRSLLPALALILALAAILVSHLLLGFNYPGDRLALPLFVFLALAWAIGVAKIDASRVPNKAFRIANGVIAIVLIAQFAHQFHLHYFTIWQFDVGIRPVARRLRDDLRGKPANSVSVSATWYQTPALEYYRNAYRIAALKPIERMDPAPLDGYDYYVLNGDDRGRKAAHSPGTVPLFYDDLSGVQLVK